MYRVKIITVGKTKEAWLDKALAEYTKRLTATVRIEWILVKQDRALSAYLQKEPRYLALDPHGTLLSSEEFSLTLHRQWAHYGPEICFVIGGAEGLSSEIKKQATMLLSFSSLTFTHQICRLLLLEQLYRALEIAKGSSYHK